MRKMFGLCLGFIALAVWAEDASWRLPLSEKEVALEADNVARHNILGLYPSQVEVPLDGGPMNPSTRGYADIAHAVCWTSNYLAGASYRYAFLKKSGAPEAEVAKALARADELFEAVYRCQQVAGIKGLQARGYALGHGESYEERGGAENGPIWHQGVGEFQDLRWRGSPSHHNYSDATHGIMQYYDLAAQGKQKDRARDAIVNLVGYWVDNDFKVQHYKSKEFTHVLGFTDGKTLNTRVMMAIAETKYAHYVSGEKRFLDMYNRLLDQFHVRGLKTFKTEKDFDDAEHVICHLENLYRIEQDPELRAAFRAVADGIWETHVNDGQSLFTYIYYAIAPDAPGRDKAFIDALYTLQTWPTDTLLQPRMSSLHPDLKPPFPMYAASWDNEYVWKGNLLSGDGWLSRNITGVAVPAEDPMVIYAIDDAGDVYQSRDGAATAGQWFPIDEPLGNVCARKVFAGSRVRFIGIISDKDTAYLSTTGGTAWRQLPIPEDKGKPVSLIFDPEDPDVMYAVTEKGAYRSERKIKSVMGEKWEPCSSRPEVLPTVSYGEPITRPGDPSAQYKAGSTAGAMFSADGGKQWTSSTEGLAIPLISSLIAPMNTTWLFAGTPAGLFISKDGGKTWEDGHLVLQFIKNTRREIGGAAFIDAYWRARYYGFIDDAMANTPYTAEK